MNTGRSLQEELVPTFTCFGCGPANPEGLGLRSFVVGDEVVADWIATDAYAGSPGPMCGGILTTLMDCHATATAAKTLMDRDGLSETPAIVCRDLSVRFRRPAPTQGGLHLVGKVARFGDKGPIVEVTISTDDEVCARFEGTFVNLSA